MIEVNLYRGKKVAVFGLARSGLSAAKSLIAGGAEILAWDDEEKNRNVAAGENIPLVDLNSADWKNISALVLSPGIPHTFPTPHPIVTAARTGGVKIISDIYLLMHTQTKAKYIGITGTNGKSTTTSLIAHILKQAGENVQVGGNLGQAALTLDPVGDGGYYVLELSSYQLELMPDCRLHAAVHLNLTPDHLDRHGDMDGYLNAKKNIFAHQQKSDAAVIGVDDAPSKKMFDEISARSTSRTFALSVGQKLERGTYVLDGILYDATPSRTEKIMDLRDAAALPGEHNWQNAAAAYAVAKFINVPRETICDLIVNFPGLAHRQQKIATIDGTVFINDSKATNPEAAAKALACYRPIYWIAGGKPKGEDLDACAPFYHNIQQAFLIGQAAEMFEKILTPHMPCKISGTLEQAIADAAAQAKLDGMHNPIVLLSPACASFDQFRDFEHRGDVFCKTVLELEQNNKRKTA